MSPNADDYLRAIHFAARAHGEQKTISGAPYVVHLATVAMEVMFGLRHERGCDEALGLTCAALHDVVEDTTTALETVSAAFGPRVAAGIAALSKNPSLPKERQMADSLERILRQSREIAMVKLADRITNLASAPAPWSTEKLASYRQEGQQILDALGGANAYLAARLAERIAQYPPPR